MARLSEIFPSKYLSAADLNEQDLIVTIQGVEPVRLKGRDGGPDETKLVAHFHGQEKGLLLNKTNAQTIANLYGDETDDWIGERITLFPTTVQFQGQMTEAIRVRPRRPKDAVRPKAAPAARAHVEPEQHRDGPQPKRDVLAWLNAVDPQGEGGIRDDLLDWGREQGFPDQFKLWNDTQAVDAYSVIATRLARNETTTEPAATEEDDIPF